MLPGDKDEADKYSIVADYQEGSSRPNKFQLIGAYNSINDQT